MWVYAIFIMVRIFLLNFIATLGTCIYTQTINGTNIFPIFKFKTWKYCCIHIFSGLREVITRSKSLKHAGWNFMTSQILICSCELLVDGGELKIDPEPAACTYACERVYTYYFCIILESRERCFLDSLKQLLLHRGYCAGVKFLRPWLYFD
jgi:hypothetical protein